MKGSTEVTFCGVSFRNPIVVASTDIGRSEASFEAFARAGVGGIITKSVTDAAPLQKAGITMFDIRDMKQIPGRGEIPGQYYFFSRGGAMIAMEDFLPLAERELKLAQDHGVVLIGSISASKVENWVAYAKAFEELGYPMLELNFGNPHGEAAKEKLGFLIGQSPELCAEIVARITEAVRIPVVAKLTPQVTDITQTAAAVKASGARAVTITHRFQGLIVDRETETPVLGGFAAIGGPWMKPITLANIAKVYRATGMEIMGGNGADTAEDVLDFLYAGASLVQIGSSMMLRGPEYGKALVEEVAAKAKEPLRQLRGRVAERIVPYQELRKIAARKAAVDERLCADCKDHPCISRCYFGALEDAGGPAAYHEDFCSGCGLCQTVCPHDAVKIISSGQQ